MSPHWPGCSDMVVPSVVTHPTLISTSSRSHCRHHPPRRGDKSPRRSQRPCRHPPTPSPEKVAESPRLPATTTHHTDYAVQVDCSYCRLCYYHLKLYHLIVIGQAKKETATLVQISAYPVRPFPECRPVMTESVPTKCHAPVPLP